MRREIILCRLDRVEQTSIHTYLREEIFKGINFREFFSDISRELIFANWASMRISRELIFANLAYPRILRELVFAKVPSSKILRE